MAADVGSEEGTLELLIPLKDGWKPMHQITHRAAGSGSEGLKISVPCLRLDGYWQGLGAPDISFLKIDTEGQELRVLEGARALLERCRPAVFCEVEAPYLERLGQTPAEAFELFHGLGYRAFRANAEQQLVPVAGYEARCCCCYFFLLHHPERWPAGLEHLLVARD